MVLNGRLAFRVIRIPRHVANVLDKGATVETWTDVAFPTRSKSPGRAGPRESWTTRGSSVVGMGLTRVVVLINADKPLQWKADIAASVDLYNAWFMESAPEAYRATRILSTKNVEQAFKLTSDLLKLTTADLKANPGVLPTLRMSTAPPIARDRLVGLANTTKALVERLERGRLPARHSPELLEPHLERICRVIEELLDQDILPWIARRQPPSKVERARAATIVADRLCGAVADPIVRNAQEQRQLALIEEYLTSRAYRRRVHPSNESLAGMEPGTFSFRMVVLAGETPVRIPVDVVIQPTQPRASGLPILIEAKSAGDFTNPNKRRKEEAQKMHQLRSTYGDEVEFILFLCGYFDSGYLGYSAAERIDWIWEHRISDMDKLGI